MNKIFKLLLIANRLFWYVSHPLYMRIQLIILKRIGVKFVGKPKYLAATSYFDITTKSKVTIGNDSVVAGDVMVLTHDFSVSRALVYSGLLDSNEEEICNYSDVTIGANCFIGARVVILPGARISDNVIVGAGSVVRGKLEPDSVYIGNPAIKISTISSISEKYKKLLEK